MTTAAGQHYQTPVEHYDPDEVVPRDSPLMKPLHPRLEPANSPPPDIPYAQIRPISGDAVLVTYLDNGRQPEIARAAGCRALPALDEEEEESLPIGSPLAEFTSHSPPHNQGVSSTIQHRDTIPSSCLQHLATDSSMPVSPNRTHASVKGDAPDTCASAAQLTSCGNKSQESDGQPLLRGFDKEHATDRSKHSMPMVIPSNGGLPPLQMDSPKSESNGQSLPSLRSTLGDLSCMPSEPPTPADKEVSGSCGPGKSFSRSSPRLLKALESVAKAQVSPPQSPHEKHQISLPSPHSLPASSPYNCYTVNGMIQRGGTEHIRSVSSDTPSTEQSVPTPATIASVADRMSIDGITNPPVGSFVCGVEGCNAPPFHTQYLLNSHANVHSSARPHYCPVQGCPRSEDGNGFKRKNEMIRHGLVHESPGYACPFCPDKEHKYPRPDNLQRHVRAHHHDRDKDDPMLREVLGKRVEGLSRRRRRRVTGSQ